MALNWMRAGIAARPPSPGTRLAGSQTKLMSDPPSASRATPNQGRMSGLARRGRGGGAGARAIAASDARCRSAFDGDQ
jgi:hypothetical protein